jgi:hypothetical protein
MCCKLALYWNMRGNLKPRIDYLDYIKHSLSKGPSFADVVKKIRSLTMLSTLGSMRFLDLEEKILEFNDRYGYIYTIDMDEKYSYDDFFNQDYLLFWSDEDVNDLQWAYEPLEIDENALSEFKDILRELLTTYKTEVLSPERTDKSTWTSDSTSFEKNPKSRTIHRNIVRRRIAEGSENPFGEHLNDWIFKRSIIPVGPANFRDAWEPDFDTLFSIKSISYVMRQVIQPIPFSAMYDPNIAYRRKRKLHKADSLYLMVDFKKSAITIPRQIVVAMGEVLSEIYPNVEFAAIKSYNSLKLHDGKNWTVPVRGVGLGNMNELFTLMQCVFGMMSKKAFGTYSLFYNDDAVYELHSSSYRKQVVLILSFMKKLGIIINLSKTMISRSTVFCEEYNTSEQIDYRKHQLLVIPMAGALYSSNTAIAKRYLYSIERGLVGTGFRYLVPEFLNILTQAYEPEFGLMDLYLPYHLGGWSDFSKTNFSSLLEYMVDPLSYNESNLARGSTPEIRRWIAFNIFHLKKEDSLLSSKARIAYKGPKLVNPYKDLELFTEKDALSSYLYGYASVLEPSEYESTLDSVIQYRGLHNAKPRIKLGLDDKILANRRRIYREFKSRKGCFPLLLSKDAFSVNLCIRYLRGISDMPSYYSYPRFLLKDSWKCIEGKRSKLIVYKRGEGFENPYLRQRNQMASTIESLRTGTWYARSDPFIFYEIWKQKKSGYLLSDEGIPRILGSTATLPKDFRLFCPNGIIFAREFAVRTGRIPLSWHNGPETISRYQMHLFKDALEFILPPDLIGEWREVKTLYKDKFSYLRAAISQLNLTKRSEFKAMMSAFREARPSLDHESSIDSGIEYHDENMLDLLERFEQADLYTRMISRVYNVEDLLDDEVIFNSDLLSEGDEISELAEFEEFDDLDSVLSAEEADGNEIRRIARSGDPLDIGDWG